MLKVITKIQIRRRIPGNSVTTSTPGTPNTPGTPSTPGTSSTPGTPSTSGWQGLEEL